MTEPKTSFLSTVDGFTPVIDVMIPEMGVMATLVYGRVWRFCQMRDRVCNASLGKIAGYLGIGTSTVHRHINALCDAGYLKDLTPDRHRKPHIYQDTGKAIITSLVQATVCSTEEQSLNYSVEEQSIPERNSCSVAETNCSVAETKIVLRENPREEEETPPPLVSSSIKTKTATKNRTRAELSGDVCSEHGVPWKQYTKNGDVWEAHKLPGGKWCRRDDVEACATIRSTVEPWLIPESPSESYAEQRVREITQQYRQMALQGKLDTIMMDPNGDNTEVLAYIRDAREWARSAAEQEGAK